DIASREIFTSPLSYGVAGFTVNRDARKNNITLDVPYLLRPGDTVDINYQTQHPGKIVVFAVDEGILQVANYSTPSPLKHFFRKRALEVETMQILDQILPEYSIVREISAAGGGMMDEADSANLNPFKRRVKKPVAYWSGVIDTDGTPASVSYTVPDYFNGSLRFMAVAVSSASMGVAEKKSLSRGHFIISPNVPTFVAPEDEFTISVNVANNVEGSGKGAKISLILETSDHLKVVDNTKQELVIDEGREKSVTYRIRARKDKLGSATIKFTTATADKQATASVDLSVRPALAKLVTVNGGHVQNSNVDIEMKRDMYPEFRKREFTASTVPLGLSNGLLQYLNDYPHLCTEQLVSKVFPIVALKNQQGLAYDAEKASQSVSNIIDILRSRQNSEGAFGFWAANSHVSEKQSLYVSHFLYEAVNEGFSVPEAMIKQSLDYARQLAQQEIKNLADARVRAYAIYLLTLNGEVTTRYLNDMREQMDKFYKNKWEQEISRAYMAAAYKLLRLDDEANNMIDDMSFDKAIEEDYSSFYDTLSRNAQLLFILSRHFKDQLAGIEAAPILSVSKLINNGSFNTLSASYSILALDAYADAFSAEENMKIVLTARDATGKKSDLPVPESRYPEFDIAEAINSLNLDASATEQPVFYQATESGFDRSLPTAKFEQGLEIHREYKDANGKLVSEIAMGEELEVHVQFRTTDGGSYYNIAIVDLLPGGFELVLDESRDSDGDWRPDYIDLREDRIIIYGHISKAAEKFVYKIKATNKGQYVVPPPYAES
ncbi:MAG: alpha-2-macroglobulin family protein, partial [Gammaproteobacteria bacterium]|nr:alpha-2-macroglobulin family protein [Gammaproteobacteria bacterium]